MAVTRNGHDYSFFVNGQPSARSISTISVLYQNSFLVFGMDYKNKNNYFKGTMDHIAIYSQSLSESDVNSLYLADVDVPTYIPTSAPQEQFEQPSAANGGSSSEGSSGVECDVYCLISTFGSIFLGLLGLLLTWYIFDRQSRTCNICGNYFKTIDELKAHRADRYSEVCRYCDENCYKVESRSEHEKVCKKRKCQPCEMVFDNESELTVHGADLHSQECRYCGITHQDNCAEWKCRYCSNEFSRIDDFKAHYADVHSQQCRFCGERLASSNTRRSHETSHRTGECQYCKGTTFTNDELKTHYADVHSLHCGLCYKLLASVEKRKTHEATCKKAPNRYGCGCLSTFFSAASSYCEVINGR